MYPEMIGLGVAIIISVLIGLSGVLDRIKHIPFGMLTGTLWKHIKGQDERPQFMFEDGACKPTFTSYTASVADASITDGGRKYYPTLRSFVFSLLYRLTPAITAAIITYYFYEKSHIFIIILDVITGLGCFYLLLNTAVVHLTKINLFEEGVIISGLTHQYGVKWEDIDKVLIRERHNLISRNEKLLAIYLKNNRKLAFQVSVLSKKDENEVLLEVRKRVPTSSAFDSPRL